jgi:hypothetical protein
MADDKQQQPKMDDTPTSTTLTSLSVSVDEKALEDEPSAEPELNPVMSAKEVQAELTRIMTSGEDVEYPTGVKLNLISLALCLSVFLMALDNTIVRDSPKKYFHVHSIFPNQN